MNIDKKQHAYVSIFRQLTDPGAQWEYLFMLGSSQTPSCPVRTAGCLIPECQTLIWLKLLETYPAVDFVCDSDSVLVKGVLKIFEDLYIGCPVKEIHACPPYFLDSISEEVIYLGIKQNGLKRFYETLKNNHIKGDFL